MPQKHTTHTTLNSSGFDYEKWLNYNKKERPKPLKNMPYCLRPDFLALVHDYSPQKLYIHLNICYNNTSK